ncbi:MAG: hypothetical protein FGM37_00535, partial [Phycisphaerales bacterium]|nr:hypothetical protein [Phycisphaerales bacterium]
MRHAAEAHERVLDLAAGHTRLSRGDLAPRRGLRFGRACRDRARPGRWRRAAQRGHACRERSQRNAHGHGAGDPGAAGSEGAAPLDSLPAAAPPAAPAPRPAPMLGVIGAIGSTPSLPRIRPCSTRFLLVCDSGFASASRRWRSSTLKLVSLSSGFSMTVGVMKITSSFTIFRSCWEPK